MATFLQSETKSRADVTHTHITPWHKHLRYRRTEPKLDTNRRFARLVLHLRLGENKQVDANRRLTTTRRDLCFCGSAFWIQAAFKKKKHVTAGLLFGGNEKRVVFVTLSIVSSWPRSQN